MAQRRCSTIGISYLERTIKVNTSKSRTYSFFRQGVIYYQLLPKMKEANAVLLMDKFIVTVHPDGIDRKK